MVTLGGIPSSDEIVTTLSAVLFLNPKLLTAYAVNLYVVPESNPVKFLKVLVALYKA